MLKPHGITQANVTPFLLEVLKNLSQVNDHKLKLAQLLQMPELRNSTDIRALYDLINILMEDACFAVSGDCIKLMFYHR